MSQITNHVLDPYNTPVLLVVNEDEVKNSMSEDMEKLALNDVFGFGDGKDADWYKVLKRYLIIDMFNCTQAVSLNEDELECLVGSVYKGLDRQVPCTKRIKTKYIYE